MFYQTQHMDDQDPDAIKHYNPPQKIGKHGSDKCPQIIPAFNCFNVNEINTIKIVLPFFELTDLIHGRIVFSCRSHPK